MSNVRFADDSLRRVEVDRQQSSLSNLITLDGKEFDLSNLLPADYADTSGEQSLCLSKATFIHLDDKDDGLETESTSSCRSSMSLSSRSQSCRRTIPEKSLYPQLAHSDSSLDLEEDVNDIFSRLLRRKSTGALRSNRMCNSSNSFQPTYGLASEIKSHVAERLSSASLKQAPIEILELNENNRPISPNKRSDSWCHESQVDSLPSNDTDLVGTEDECLSTVGIVDCPKPSAHLTRSYSATINRYYKVEVAPGMVMDLRGARETMDAIDSGTAASVACACCHSWLLCVPDAAAVICQDCRVMTPILSSGNSRRLRGVGLGLKEDPYE